MRDFYEKFYAAVASCQAHTAFCERVYGRNLCQHGFSDMAQLTALLEVLHLSSNQRVLDLGCGNGMVSEYISDRTGAHVTGLDYIPLAIDQAQERTRAKAERLAFKVADINALDLAGGTFDAVVSIDTIYFSEDYPRTIQQWVTTLRPGGQMGMFFSHGRHPDDPQDSFLAETLSPDRTPLAEALQVNGLDFRTWDFTADEYRLAQLRKQVLPELRAQFEAENSLFVYENRMAEANGISQAIEDNLHVRYLYHVQLPA